jgi:hypothetical protein
MAPPPRGKSKTAFDRPVTDRHNRSRRHPGKPRGNGDQRSVMRTSLRTNVAASLAALTIGLAVLGATPASADSWHHHGYHHGFWGPGIALGVLGLAAGAAYEASQDNCVEYRPSYDRWGHYVGQRPVNVCQ